MSFGKVDVSKMFCCLIGRKMGSRKELCKVCNTYCPGASVGSGVRGEVVWSVNGTALMLYGESVMLCLAMGGEWKQIGLFRTMVLVIASLPPWATGRISLICASTGKDCGFVLVFVLAQGYLNYSIPTVPLAHLRKCL